MPRGPSHSRSGGGGGFGGSRGGSSFRGSSSSSGSGSSRRHYSRGPRTFHWFGRTVVLSSGKYSLLVSLLSLSIFFIIITAAMIGVVSDTKKDLTDAKSAIVIYKEDDEYYENMITKALNGDEGYYTATAQFDPYLYGTWVDEDDDTGAYEYVELNGYTYYYIVYEYWNDAAQSWAQGETYTQFTSSQVQAMYSGTGSNRYGYINIAYTYDVREGGYYSINMNYSLEKNQDYQYAVWCVKEYNSDIKTTTILSVVFGVLTVGVVTGFVFVAIKSFKNAKKEEAVQDAKNAAEIAQAEANAEIAEARAASVNRDCKYCGAKVPDGADVCPSCGSRFFEKK